MANGKIQSDPDSLREMSQKLEECISDLEEGTKDITDKLEDLEGRLEEGVRDTTRKIENLEDEINALKSELAAKSRDGEDTGAIEVRIRDLTTLMNALDEHRMVLNRYMREAPMESQVLQSQLQRSCGAISQGNGVVNRYLQMAGV
ncbi:MAG: hypothetical protein LUH07_12700 [Lachnospiraceae bacterium]|nr:hypothetical protein [Lachnospiraceae bacterium]